MSRHTSFKHQVCRSYVVRRSSSAARVCVAAVQADAAKAPPAPRDSIATVTGYQRNPELQAALDDLFADTIKQGIRRVPHSQVQHHLDRITELGSQLGLNRVHPEWNDGSFHGLLTTLMSGITVDNKCTLARLTFGQVKPADLMVQTDQAAAAGMENGPDQFKGPLAKVEESPSSGYSVVTHFKVLSNGVLGKMTVKAVYGADERDPSKLPITFIGFTLEPAFSDAQSLALWREALAEDNPNMSETGAIDVQLEQRPSSALRYIMMDPDLHLALGPSGSLTTMLRVPVRGQ